jgi:hypothetical protein
VTRGLAAVLAAGLVAGSGVAVAAARVSAPPTHRQTYVPPPPTAAQLAFRKTYLADQLSGDPVRSSCGCSGAVRAKDRAEKIRAAAAKAAAATTP